MAVTRRQKEILDFLESFVGRNGYSPSFEEIARGMGLKSLATVHKHITNLEKKGLLDRVHNRSRSIDVVDVYKRQWPCWPRPPLRASALPASPRPRSPSSQRDSSLPSPDRQFPLYGSAFISSLARRWRLPAVSAPVPNRKHRAHIFLSA